MFLWSVSYNGQLWCQVFKLGKWQIIIDVSDNEQLLNEVE